MKKLIIVAVTVLTLALSGFAYNKLTNNDCCCGSECTCTHCTCTEGNCTCNASCCEATCCKEEQACCNSNK